MWVKHVYSLLLMRACEYKMKLRLSLCCPLDILKLMGWILILSIMAFWCHSNHFAWKDIKTQISNWNICIQSRIQLNRYEIKFIVVFISMESTTQQPGVMLYILWVDNSKVVSQKYPMSSHPPLSHWSMSTLKLSHWGISSLYTDT